MQLSLKEISTLSLVTSNLDKVAEFARLGLPFAGVVRGADLREVRAESPVTVAVYKALAAGAGSVVEDTALHVHGERVGTDIRWLLDNVAAYDGKGCFWEVALAAHLGERVVAAVGMVQGTIRCGTARPGAFAFDPYVVPYGRNLTLDELEQLGEKDRYSARVRACHAFLDGDFIYDRPVAEIRPWSGPWQGEQGDLGAEGPLQAG